MYRPMASPWTIAPVLLVMAAALRTAAALPPPETPVASVGDEVVSVASVQAELDAKVMETKGAFDDTDPGERRAVVDRLIERRLYYLGALAEIPGARAIADSVRHHEQIRATWLSLKRGLHPGPEALTPEAIEAFREERAAAWFGRHILVMTPEEVEDVQARLAQGEDFVELAKELSYDAGSAAIGGLLYPLRAGDWYPEIIDEAFSLSPGEVGEPVRSRNGWHIMRCDSILYTPEAPDVFTTHELRLRRVRMSEFNGIEAAIDEHVAELGIRVTPRAVDVVTEHLRAVGNPTKPPEPDPSWTPPADVPMATSALGDTMFIPEFLDEMDVLLGYDWPYVRNPVSVETAAERLMIAYVLRRRMNEGAFDPGPVARAEIDAVVHRHLGNLYFREVLDPGPVDSTRAEAIFAEHPEAFLVPPQASVAILGVPSEALADSVEAWLAAGMSFGAAGARVQTLDEESFYYRPTPLFTKGTFPEHDDLVFSQLEVGGVSARERTSSGYQWYHLTRREPERRASRLELSVETLMERARAYLHERERLARLARLREQHPVVIDAEVLGEIVGHAD